MIFSSCVSHQKPLHFCFLVNLFEVGAKGMTMIINDSADVFFSKLTPN